MSNDSGTAVPGFIEVHVGTFTCPHCGARWVGRWQGPKEKITCLACKKLIKEQPDDR